MSARTIHREKEYQSLWRYLERSRNILMLAPRRAGKTFLLEFLRENAEEKGYSAVKIDVSGASDEKAFCRELCATIQEEQKFGTKLISTFSANFQQLLNGEKDSDWRKILLQNDFESFAAHLLGTLNNDKTCKWLIVIDELPLFILSLINNHSPEKAKQFLYWLRKAQQQYKNLRWIYAGSIGLDNVARQYGMEGALVDLEIYNLPAFTADTAKNFLQTIAKKRGCTINQDAGEMIINRLGWLSPYYLEHIAEDACELAQTSQGHINREIATQAIDQMLDRNKRTYWSTWREHIDKNFPDREREALIRILEVLAKAESPVSKDTLIIALNDSLVAGEQGVETILRHCIDILLNDGYIEITNGQYHFLMGLLREWWRQYVLGVE